jgi:hypothetical protein
VVHLLEGADAGFRQKIDGTTRAYQVLPSKTSVYYVDNYGNSVARQMDTSNCSHVFINFGHWPLRLNQDKPWDALHFAQQVKELAVSMKQQQQQHGNHQFWLTLQPTAVIISQQDKSQTKQAIGWRTDPFILVFNKVASTVMQAHGLPIVDIYSIASPLFDMSYDATHYIGTVGLAQANMLANIVCGALL